MNIHNTLKQAITTNQIYVGKIKNLDLTFQKDWRRTKYGRTSSRGIEFAMIDYTFRLTSIAHSSNKIKKYQ